MIGNLLLKALGPFQPSQNSIIGYIDILDTMYIELDVIIHSFPSGWANIIHCTPDEDFPRLPGIWIHANSSTKLGFWARFSNDEHVDYGPYTGGALLTGTSYHLEIDITQSSHKVTVNDVVLVNEVVSAHSLYDNITCYASDPWYHAADVTISNWYITGESVDGTSLCYIQL